MPASRQAIFLRALVLFGAAFAVPAGLARAQSTCGDPLAAEAQVASSLSLNQSEQDGVRQFYRDRDPNPATGATGCAWSDGSVAALRAVLSRADDQGLDPARYHPASLAGAATPTRDIAATAMALRYAHDATMGEVDEAQLSGDIDVPRPNLDLPARLAAALDGDRAGQWLAGLEPRDPQYQALVKALATYRRRAGRGDAPSIPDGPRLALGDSGMRVIALKARLIASGDLPATDRSPKFDRRVRAAVMGFQKQHGLKPDGVVGPDTLAALNFRRHDRVRTILANLERRRYFDHVLAPTRIEVNAAGATATLYREGRPVLGMRAIVGDPDHPTPMLISPKLENIELDPPWIVPQSIIRKEMLPKEARDPGYFAAHHMHWVGNELIQSPGPKNALGRVKFNFANRYSVYLHDTPGRSLFAKYDRADSHGCVRLEKPIDLALAVLPATSGWPLERIVKAIARNKTVHIPIADGPQIVLTYWTAFAGPDGKIEFRDDLYGRDGRLLAAMPAPGVDKPVAALAE